MKMDKAADDTETRGTVATTVHYKTHSNCEKHFYYGQMHYQQAKSFLCHNGNPCAFLSSTFEGYFESRHKEIFKLLLLHSNSQLANLLSSPAKNAS